MTKLQLRVGGKYMNRAGDVIEIVTETSDVDRPFTGSDKCVYSRSGRFLNDNTSSEFDLVDEVPDKPSPTADLRERAALTAMLGILASGKSSPWNGKVVAGAAVRQADALIAALNEATDETE